MAKRIWKRRSWLSLSLGLTIVLGNAADVAAQQVAERSADAEIAAQYAIPATDEGLPGVGPIRRYEWFQQLWTTKRSQWARQVDKDQGAIVFLGDSITQGWGDDLGGSFEDAKVANRGISGDTTRGMLLRLEEDVLSLNPACVVMLMGTNDLEEKATPAQIAENFATIIAALREHNPAMPIVVCNVFPSSGTKSRPAEKIKRVNELYAEAMHGQVQVQIVDTWTLFADEKGDAKESEFPDLLHPNQAGYAKWAGALRPVFATLGFIETESKPFVPDEGFTSLFNGNDLTGWCYLPTTEAMMAQRERWKNRPEWPVVEQKIDMAEKSATEDGRYLAVGGRLVVAYPPEGRKIQQLWTSQDFPSDFTLKLEFRATPNADSGVFLRGKQLQCRDFLLAGPYKSLTKFREGDWNTLVVEVRGNVAHCTCNGEVIEEAFELPDNGPIGLEGDRGQVEYRHIQLRQ